MRITNLDSIIEEDQQVILAGKEWIIPGEIPVNKALNLIHLQQKIQEDPMNFELWDSQTQIIFEVFKSRYPDLTLEKMKEMLTARQTGHLIGLLMSSIGAATKEEEKKTIELAQSKEENQKQLAKTSTG